MKKNIIYGVVTFLLLNASIANACCYSNDYYMVSNVAVNDRLNVRKDPHPLAPIITTLNHNDRYFILNGFNDKNEEMVRHDLCVTVNYSAFQRTESISKWCQLQEPQGWVNMHYLSSCQIETADNGAVISTECNDVIEGVSVSDYMFNYKDTSVLEPSQKFLGPWLIQGKDWGFTLHDDGTASSINAATLVYQKWHLEKEVLCLASRSIGNHTQSVSEECLSYRIEGEDGDAKLTIGKTTYNRP